MANNGDKLRFVMLPWLAFGHMIPFLEIAKQIAKKGHHVTFVSTPKNIDRLLKANKKLEADIEFVRIPLPAVDNLPEDAEATSDVPYHRTQFLKIAYDMLREPVARLLELARPDWIIYDFAPYWVDQAAAELGIKLAFFSIFMGTSLGLLGPPSVMMGGDSRKTPEDFTMTPEWVPFATKVGFRCYEVKKIFDIVKGNLSGVTDMYRFGASLSNADVVMLRSSYEFEPEWIKVLGDIYKKPVFPTGLLPQQEDDDDDDNDNDDNHKAWLSIKQWLDRQKKGSVVYIAFGSEAKPNQSELTEIALGLEESKLPFFWVFRTQLGSVDTDRIELPQGFEERVKGRGIVYTSWAPQLRILGHDSVGGFLSHGGVSSFVEGLSFGRPLILIPLLYDQGVVARVLEEKGMGYPVPRREEDGWFDRESVAESLRLVMVKEEGKVYREKAKEMKTMFRNKEIQESYVTTFLDYFEANRPSRSIESK